jgi:hypothetical protein
MKLQFSRQFFQKYSKSIFINFRPVEAELFHAESQTDGHDEANSHLFKNIFHTRVLNFNMSKLTNSLW